MNVKPRVHHMNINTSLNANNFMAYPTNRHQRGRLSTSNSGPKRSAWEEFRRDDRTRRAHNISADEMDVLERIAAMGEARAARDFIYILNAIRQALGR